MLKIIVVNNVGQTVKETKAVAEKGVNTIDIDVHSLPAGIFTVIITSDRKRESITGKFMKQ